jgi:hypothetical protein
MTGFTAPGGGAPPNIIPNPGQGSPISAPAAGTLTQATPPTIPTGNQSGLNIVSGNPGFLGTPTINIQGSPVVYDAEELLSKGLFVPAGNKANRTYTHYHAWGYPTLQALPANVSVIVSGGNLTTLSLGVPGSGLLNADVSALGDGTGGGSSGGLHATINYPSTQVLVISAFTDSTGKGLGLGSVTDSLSSDLWLVYVSGASPITLNRSSDPIITNITLQPGWSVLSVNYTHDNYDDPHSVTAPSSLNGFFWVYGED